VYTRHFGGNRDPGEIIDPGLPVGLHGDPVVLECREVRRTKKYLSAAFAELVSGIT